MKKTFKILLGITLAAAAGCILIGKLTEDGYITVDRGEDSGDDDDDCGEMFVDDLDD